MRLTQCGTRLTLCENIFECLSHKTVGGGKKIIAPQNTLKMKIIFDIVTKSDIKTKFFEKNVHK